MRKFSILLISLIILCPGFIKANPIQEQEALKAAKHFFARNSQLRSSSIEEPKMLITEKDGQRAYYYVISDQTTNAWVVLSADDEIDPILAYSNNENWGESINPIFKIYLDNFKDHFDMIKIQNPSKLRSSDEKNPKQKWEELLNENLLRSTSALLTTPIVDVLLKTEGQYILWAQRANFSNDPGQNLYNKDCPTINGNKTLTGCVATAMGMLIKYWGDKSPDKKIYGNGQFSYKHSTLGILSMDYTGKVYDTSKMPPLLTGFTSGNYTTDGKTIALTQSTQQQIDEVAKLLYDCGISVDMGYDIDGSGAINIAIPGALASFFGFGRSISLDKDNYSGSSTDWYDILKRELNASRPIIYGGVGTEGGHAFLIDGYDSDGNFHINWGWGGSQNGYINMNIAFKYPSDQSAIINIQPNNNDYLQVLDLKVVGYYDDATSQLGDFVLAKNPNVKLNVPVATVYNPTNRSISFQMELDVFTGNSNSAWFSLKDPGLTTTLAPGEIKEVKISNTINNLAGNRFQAGDAPTALLSFLTDLEGNNSGSYPFYCKTDHFNVLADVPATAAVNRQPINQTADIYTPVALKVYAQGKNIKYQWYKNGDLLTGKTNNPLLITEVLNSDAGKYKCVVTDENNLTENASSEITLTVTDPGDCIFSENATTTNWNNLNNWENQKLPIPSSKVVIPAGVRTTIPTNEAIRIKDLRIIGTLENNGNLQVDHNVVLGVE